MFFVWNKAEMERVRHLPKKGKKACDECRQQKAKCDVYLDLDQPCYRCRKLKIACIVSDGFTREHKRQRLEGLEREREQLRQQLEDAQQANPHFTPIALLTAAAEMGVPIEPKQNDSFVGWQDPPAPYPQQHNAPAISLSSPILEGLDATVSRTLKGITVTGKEIDDLYQLFFRHFAPVLPILDPQTRPNAYYAQSSFLFWAVIGVSSRSYPQNPTLQTALAQDVTEMAFMSVLSTCAPWHTIQGMLLLLTWPFPKENRPDVTFPLSGMLLHVAMQNGFHIPMSSHEFSRISIPAPSELDMVRRSELWAHCVLVYQRSCVIKGQSPRNLVNLAQDPTQHQVLFDKIAPGLALKLRCQELVTKCSEAVLENGVRAMTLDQERSLDILLRRYESQVDELELQTVADDETFHLLLCRMAIQSFHFYKSQTTVSSGCLPRLIVTACSLIDYVQALRDRMGFLSMAPVQIGFGVLLASISLLRILKSNIACSSCTNLLFATINLAKQMSTDRTDTAAKTITVVNQLWNSSKAFRKADGSEYTALRIRSRLILSQILDAVWWWRDEFDPGARAKVRGTDSFDGCSSRNYAWPADTGRPATGSDPNREPFGSTIQNLSAPQEQFQMDEDFFSNFEWALSDDALLSLDSCSTNWSMTNHLP
ncbi:hypothetical protein N7460_008272 [Penicillium canescens]|uniref:Zn(2)-C6 fungal-type domain-containing protein n=1 Tax=Penicillium canescens TaxID=5083 RepID=A0AAD6I9L1_PENCN|nr:hypothetical protein N7460_008272 [Penicillium canescens]KAJ6039439.1 hypothetical protein N7444_008344 [Penicillium canescens]KAJ6161559.1 hypothetical protein N7485_009789 [Penicillium canescens]